jgi:hypothetical protein
MKTDATEYLRPADVRRAESAMLLYDFNKMKLSKRFKEQWFKKYGRPNDGTAVR